MSEAERHSLCQNRRNGRFPPTRRPASGAPARGEALARISPSEAPWKEGNSSFAKWEMSENQQKENESAFHASKKWGRRKRNRTPASRLPQSHRAGDSPPGVRAASPEPRVSPAAPGLGMETGLSSPAGQVPEFRSHLFFSAVIVPSSCSLAAPKGAGRGKIQ